MRKLFIVIPLILMLTACGGGMDKDFVSDTDAMLDIFADDVSNGTHDTTDESWDGYYLKWKTNVSKDELKVLQDMSLVMADVDLITAQTDEDKTEYKNDYDKKTKEIADLLK